MSGEELLQVLGALSNPHRLRIVAALYRGSTYVSQLARDLELSRPLLHMHLQRLAAAGLVEGHLEVSEDGKAMRFYENTGFALSLDPATIAVLAQSLTEPASGDARKNRST